MNSFQGWDLSRADNVGVSVDWSESPDVEIIEGKVSGKTLLRNSRIPADMLVGYYESLLRCGMKPDVAFADTNESYPGRELIV